LKTLLNQVTYVFILIINVLLIGCLFYAHFRMCTITDKQEQLIAWQTLENTIEKADFFFDKNEMACVEISEFASLSKNDTVLLYHALSQFLKNNGDLHATFVCFFDSTHKQNAYLIRDKNNIKRASFNDYISGIKQKFLKEHFEKNLQKPLWEDPIMIENQAHINLFVPFFDKSDRLNGFVGFNMNLAQIDTLLRSALTYYENDAHAFMFMLVPNGTAAGVAGSAIRKNENLFQKFETANDNASLSMIYNMRNGETTSLKFISSATETDNLFFYKSLKNKKISILLSYHENQSKNAWSRLFWLCIGVLLFCLTIISLWLWWYWKRRKQIMDQIGERLHAIENGSTKSDLPSSFQHKDLDNLCSKIKNMQNGLEQRKKELVVSTGVYERRDNERDLSRYIRQYFYPYQSYDASLSQKIRQHLKINYLRDVGGDFHDYFNITPNLICFVTGTVSRPKKSISNIQTAIDILMTMSLIRSHFRVYSTLSQLVFNLNNDLYSQNKGKFTVNIFMGVLNCETGILEYFSAGAPTHYMISHRSIFPISVQHGLPLASKENSEVYPIGKRELFSGDMLLVHTDGVLSRQNSTSEKYGQGRLQTIMSTASGSEPANFLEKIVEDITDFSKNQSLQVDDYTLFAIKYEDRTHKNI